MDEKNKEYEELPTEAAALAEESASTEISEPTADSNFSTGIQTENYDIMPELKSKPEELAELEGKDCVEVEYTFSGEDIRKGLKIYQGEILFLKNTIYTMVLVVLFGLYMVNIFRYPGQGLYYFLAALCLIVVGALWYLPKRHIKKTAAAVDMQEMRFHMGIYDNCICVFESANGFVLHYRKEVTKVVETPEYFLFCVGKERLFILPKRCLESEQEAKIQTFVKDGMGDKYKAISERK